MCKNKGFSLIELIVVLVILGITTSLLAPDMFGVLKRSQAKTEVTKIQVLAELSIERSFFSQNKIKLYFKEHKLEISQVEPESKMIKSIESDFFSFKETTILIDQGDWLGSESVKLLKSPSKELTYLVLHEKTNGNNTAKESNEGL